MSYHREHYERFWVRRDVGERVKRLCSERNETLTDCVSKILEAGLESLGRQAGEPRG